MSDDPPRDATLPPGYDEDDPYADADLDGFPEWWRRNAAEFREHGMRPYRPPRFADGTPCPERVEALEAELGVDVRFQVRDPQAGGEWRLVVDDEAVAPVEHTRTGEGYTVYGLTPDEFEGLVREAVGEATGKGASGGEDA